ncbi:chromosome partitioning protein ParA [Glutamicibacter uratoxydans]|uniref:Chromosome partitioning protein ParA n=1 Tax=Glutamicibacter uratoxydans TaxID=43667 RepID=A0A4Y4DL13_GLUUR|nr:phage portal protein [Glutamicibacter uratoxydans]GED04514.1 chromosome partitioning protein ParA [Glutamicibacter uratoxydans]
MFEGSNIVAPNMTNTVEKRIEEMTWAIRNDREAYNKFKDYLDGNHALPHVPASARAEVREIRDRSTLNLIPLLVGIPSQISFVDGLRRSKQLFPEEWTCWKRSRMQSKQTTIFRTALIYGVSYVAYEEESKTDKKRFNLLSTRDTVAFYEDPVNDRFPVYAYTIKSHPRDEDTPGRAVYYDEDVTIHYDLDTEGNLTNAVEVFHGLGVCPVVRFVCQPDDAGNTRGVIESMIPVQDRVNQTSFDLLMTQSFSSWKLRWASGMMGDPVFDENGDPKIDADGNQVYKPIPISQSTWITVDDPAAKVGTLDETPLNGFIEAFELAVKHFAVVGQLPPHSLLGNMSNLSAETLQAAMSQTLRFGHVLKTSWGDAMCDLFALVAKDQGVVADVEDYEAEVRWRDMSDNTLAAVVDALGKAVQMLGVPGRGLWGKIPGMTTGDVEMLEELADEQGLNAMVDDPSLEAATNREASGPLELRGLDGAQ